MTTRRLNPATARRCTGCGSIIGAEGALVCSPCRRPSLVDAASERAAMASGRPLSQERALVLGCDVAPMGPLFEGVR